MDFLWGSIEWLKGETDEYETDITDKKELQIRDAMGDILKQLPLDLSKKEDAFSKDLLLLMLKQYNLFLESFQFACKNYKGNTNEADIAKVMGFESNDEYNEIMFLREITHTVNAFNDMIYSNVVAAQIDAVVTNLKNAMRRG